MSPTVSGEVRCDCADGYRVFACLADGREFVTDAEGTNSAQASAWIERVRERAAELPKGQRLRAALRLERMLDGLQFIARPCSDCGGQGWLYRLSLDASQVPH